MWTNFQLALIVERNFTLNWEDFLYTYAWLVDVKYLWDIAYPAVRQAIHHLKSF